MFNSSGGLAQKNYSIFSPPCSPTGGGGYLVAGAGLGVVSQTRGVLWGSLELLWNPLGAFGIALEVHGGPLGVP